MSVPPEESRPPKAVRSTQTVAPPAPELAEAVEELRGRLSSIIDAARDAKIEAARVTAAHKREIEKAEAEHKQRIEEDDAGQRRKIEITLIYVIVGAGAASLLVGFIPRPTEETRKATFTILTTLITAGFAYLAGKGSIRS